MKLKTKLELKGILGFIERKITPFGTKAKGDCVKEYLAKNSLSCHFTELINDLVT